MLCAFGVRGVGVQGVLVQRELREERVVEFGDRAARPVLEQIAGLKLLQIAAEPLASLTLPQATNQTARELLRGATIEDGVSWLARDHRGLAGAVLWPYC